MQTIFNVLDYGAVNDGNTDSTKRIQAALNAAAECRGKVIVPPGTYKVGRLKLSEGVALEGTAAWSFRDYGACVFELCDENTDCMIDITDAFGCSINGMSLDGKGLGSDIHGVFLSRDQYNGGGKEDTPAIDNCKIGNFTGNGVHLDKIWCYSVRHSMLCSNGGAGLYMDGWDAFILDNWFSGNKNGGLRSDNVACSLTVTGNRVEWNGRCGFGFTYGDSYNITGNFFDRTFGPALILGGNDGQAVHTITITGNIFRRSGAQETSSDEYESSHIYIHSCENAVITGNSFRLGENDGGGGRRSPDYGIVIEDMDSCIIKDNVMKYGFCKDAIVINGDVRDSIHDSTVQ